MQVSPAGGRNPGFRADIEGLRAVAVLAVVLFHAHVGFLAGGYVGVDVFFVISGYLITDLLWRELERTHGVSLTNFYGRRMRRLLPASMLVLIVTMIASLRWLPPLQVASVWRDGLASALYVGNYRFAATQTDYLSAGGPVSPFQHYWSLGVEEQFYLLWPVLIIVGARAWRRRGASRMSASAVLSIVTVGSFVTSLILTRTDEPWAFFSLQSRAWELGAGALLALSAPWVRRMPTGLAAMVGWVGLAAIAWAILDYSSATAFPGIAALAPVGGAIGVIAGGMARPPFGPVLLLRTTVMRFFGRISYSLYLWHWPVLILTPYIVGHALNEAEYLALVAVSVVLAAATFLLVERPARDARWIKTRPHRSLTMGAAFTACGVATCLIASVSIPSVAGKGLAPVAALPQPTPLPTPGRSAAAGAAVADVPPDTIDPLLASFDAAQGAVTAAVSESVTESVVPANLSPPLADAAASQPQPDADGCLLSYQAEVSPTCLFGDPTGASSVVLFGDSHAAMWFPAIDAYAVAQKAKLYVWTKATCPPLQLPMFSPVLGREFSECDSWRADVLARIQTLKPALVVFGIAPNYNPVYHITQYGPQWMSGLTSMISAVRQTGSRVVVIGPVPTPNDVIPDCLSAHLDDAQACDVAVQSPPGQSNVGYNRAWVAAEQQTVELAEATFINVGPWFCTMTTCPAIVDNLLVYRDSSHITVPYATYLSPLIVDTLERPDNGP